MTEGPWQPGVGGRRSSGAGQSEPQAAQGPEAGAGTGTPTRTDAQTTSAFVPLLLVGLALLGWTVFQTVELIGEHRGLTAAQVAQQTQVERAEKLRASLSTLASDTQKLADGGDAGAKLIIDQLHQRGITINPNASSSSGAP